MSTEQKEVSPPYAGRWEVPEAVEVAWGARWIITQDGGVDFVWDRQGATPEGSDAWPALQAWLDGGALKGARERASALLRDYNLTTREDRDVVLWTDLRGIVRCNPRASYGYCYVVAYLLPEEAGK